MQRKLKVDRSTDCTVNRPPPSSHSELHGVLRASTNPAEGFVVVLEEESKSSKKRNEAPSQSTTADCHVWGLKIHIYTFIFLNLSSSVQRNKQVRFSFFFVLRSLAGESMLITSLTWNLHANLTKICWLNSTFWSRGWREKQVKTYQCYTSSYTLLPIPL